MIKTLQEHLAELREACLKYSVRRLDVVGSALGDDFDTARSDLDFVVSFDNLAPENAPDRFFGLLADLEDLFSTRVDLISYTTSKNPYFKQVVDRTRSQLYAA